MWLSIFIDVEEAQISSIGVIKGSLLDLLQRH